MKKIYFIFIAILLIYNCFGQLNKEVLGGCNFYISNPPTYSIYCKNSCIQTIDLCQRDSIHLFLSYSCNPGGPPKRLENQQKIPPFGRIFGSKSRIKV